MKIYPTRKWLALVLAYLAFPVLSLAQGEMSVQFVSFPPSTASEPVELITGEGAVIAVELPSNNLSKAYKVPKLANWTLGKSGTNAEGKSTFETYGKAPALPSASQVVIVIRNGSANSEGFTLIPFASDNNGLTGGKYMFFNASKVDIAAQIGELKFTLNPLKHTLVAPKPSREENGRKYLDSTLYFRRGNEAEPFYTSTWRFNEKARSMVFFYHEPHNNRLRIHTIRDYIP